MEPSNGTWIFSTVQRAHRPEHKSESFLGLNRHKPRKLAIPRLVVTVAASDSKLGTRARTAVERRTVVQDTRANLEVYTAHAQECSPRRGAVPRHHALGKPLA